jgi:hypothetical protein
VTLPPVTGRASPVVPVFPAGRLEEVAAVVVGGTAVVVTRSVSEHPATATATKKASNAGSMTNHGGQVLVAEAEVRQSLVSVLASILHLPGWEDLTAAQNSCRLGRFTDPSTMPIVTLVRREYARAMSPTRHSKSGDP